MKPKKVIKTLAKANKISQVTTRVTKKSKSRYKTGIHHSAKCSKPFKYRSGWEKTVATYLDNNPLVKKYEYETLQIPYIIKEEKHSYWPDYVVWYTNNPKPVIVEVKRQDKLSDPVVMAKTKAARLWAEQNGYSYQLWTDSMIKKLQTLNSSQKPKKKHTLWG